jgi:hypothetical protein
VELSRLIATFAEVFNNVKDVSITLDRLLNRQLVEANTRSTKTVLGASHIRVTAAGWYYLKHLSKTFAYLDLILQDTPLNNSALAAYLRQSVYEVNNLADSEKEKVKRMQVRFDRTARFLTYLEAEENAEYQAYDLYHAPRNFRHKFMPYVFDGFRNQRVYIEQRLSEGRTPDVPDTIDEPPPTNFEILSEKADDLGGELSETKGT